MLAIADGSPLDELDILERVKQWYRLSRRYFSDWRVAAREDFAFMAGDQWLEEDRQKLKQQLRPIITYNRIGVVVDSVAGMEVNNRQEVRYMPRQEGAAGPNEVLSGAGKWARDECDAEDEESDAFLDMLICGEGDTETRMDYEVDADGKILIERGDPLEFYWDPAAKRRNREDARFVIRVRMVDIADAREMFPDAEDSDLDADWAAEGEDQDGKIDREAARYYEGTSTPSKIERAGKVRLVECQWWEREPYYRVADPGNGQIVELSVAQYRELKARIAELKDDQGQPIPMLESVKQMRRCFKRAFLGKKVLESGRLLQKLQNADGDETSMPEPPGFTYKCITGKRDRNKGVYYGLVRAMKDPQRWANSFMSTILHIMATSGKGILAEEGVFDDIRDAEAKWTSPDSITTVAQGAISSERVMPKPGSQLPPGLPDMVMQAISAIRDVSGVNLEMLGLADREQGVGLEYQRKQSAMVILATLFDSLRRYRKVQGRLLLYFIQNYLSDGRLIRITGPDGAQYVRLAKDASSAEYDTIVDDAPSSPNQKEATWAVLQGILPVLMKLPLPMTFWQAVIKQSPLPNSFAEQVSKILDAQSKQPPQQDPKIQLQIMREQGDQQNAAAAIQLEQAKLQVEKEKSAGLLAIKQMDVEADLQKDHADLQLKRELGHMKIQHEAQISALKATVDGKTGANMMPGFDKLAETFSKVAEALNKPKHIIHHPITGKPRAVAPGLPNGSMQ